MCVVPARPSRKLPWLRLVSRGIRCAGMAYVIPIGLRYLRSKKRSTISLITVVAVLGVALGVGSFLAVLSITSGFQDEFRNKVLGVNAHVIVFKYGLDFREYRDVVRRAEQMPEVAGAGPFRIAEMMLAKGDRISGVLAKGIDPDAMERVLDLPSQMIQGSLDNLRRPGAAPPESVDDIDFSDDGLDQMLRDLRNETDDGGGPHDEAPTGDEALTPEEVDALTARILDGGALVEEGDETLVGQIAQRMPDASVADADTALASGEDGGEDIEHVVDELPIVDVPTPEEVEAQLAELEQQELPSDDVEHGIFQEEEALAEPEEATADLPGIVVGTSLAKSLGIGVGDRVKVISPLAGLDVSLWAAAPRTPRSRDFRVIGIFEAGFQEYDTRLVYMDLYEVQSFSEKGDVVTGVEVRLNDLDRAPEIARRLERELGGGPFHTTDWKRLNENLFAALEIQKIILSAVIATIIVVAAFNVIATLIMVVLEKKREIAILKAMGATDRTILGIFMVQGTIIGVFGTVLGLLLGGGVCAYLTTYEFPLDPKVYLIDHVPVRTSPTEYVITVIVALLICVCATLIPSWWAARLLPADGVRFQ